TDQELFESKQRIWAGEKWAVVKWIQVNTIAPYCSARTKLRAGNENGRLIPNNGIFMSESTREQLIGKARNRL
ncbi:MAG: ClbS/DfsB family four-helix bundle protein, partial [Chthoniobacterales bacterium]